MNIKLSNDTEIDLDKLIESRMLVQANSGGGKSWALRRFIEQAFGKKQIIILDPEGEFGNLRKEYDFVYIGEGGDAPAEPRSAALLARRLLETKANAIIDIYELGSHRSEFIQKFFDAVVNMPKELWTDCFFILDEAHKFAPEKGQGESIALSSVVDMASLGRKRGYCLIPATQRPAKLSKDVVSECNNKLIGRASLDIDRERSAKELGFRSKEDILSLRDLEPGEFYVFGPAISKEVRKTVIGDVKVKPPKRGTGRSQKIAPPTARVKKWLAELADLPKEAEKELKTATELRTALATAKRTIAQLERKPVEKTVEVEKEVKVPFISPADIKKLESLADRMEKAAAPARELMNKILQNAELMSKPYFVANNLTRKTPLPIPSGIIKPVSPPPQLRITKVEELNPDGSSTDITLGKGEKVVLAAIAGLEDGMTREHITVQTSYKRSTRDAYVQRLIQKGYAEISGDKIRATQLGIIALGSDYKPLPVGQELVDHHLRTLPQGESTILRLLVEEARPMSRDEITERTTYQRSTRDAYIQRLGARQLVVIDSQGVSASPFLI